MGLAEILCIVMFITVCGVLMAGFPVAFSLAGTGLAFAALGSLLGVFDVSLLGALPSRIFGNAMTNEVLAAVPLFVFMGVMLERSRVAEELLETFGRLFGSVRGGLGVSVSIVGALLAASTGIVGATVVTMGLLSLPTMLKRGYSPSLACGSICAAGTLGQIIPPSIVLVLLADQISNAHVDAQRALGNFAPAPVSTGDLFAGALLPGLALVAMYIAYQFMVAWMRPESAPALPPEDHGQGLLLQVLRALLPPVVLIIAVLGSILAGVATPTEAAAVGAVGAMLLAGIKVSARHGQSPRLLYAGVVGLAAMLVLAQVADLRVSRNVIGGTDQAAIAVAMAAAALLGLSLVVATLRLARAGIDGEDHDRSILNEVMTSTLRISSMVFVILIGAAVFSLIFRGFGGDDMVHDALSSLPGGALGAMIAVMAVMFLLGFFLDFIEITFVVVPLVAPVLLMMGLDPVWLGVMMAMNLQTSFLTPPFGFSLFYLRGIAPPSVTTQHIYKGVIPFVAIQLFALVMLAFYPEAATWLPSVIYD